MLTVPRRRSQVDDDLHLVPAGLRPRKGAPDTFDVGGLRHTLARQVLDLVRQAERVGSVERVTYELRGKFGGAGLGGMAFSRSGEIDLSGIAR